MKFFFFYFVSLPLVRHWTGPVPLSSRCRPGGVYEAPGNGAGRHSNEAAVPRHRFQSLLDNPRRGSYALIRGHVSTLTQAVKPEPLSATLLFASRQAGIARP